MSVCVYAEFHHSWSVFHRYLSRRTVFNSIYGGHVEDGRNDEMQKRRNAETTRWEYENADDENNDDNKKMFINCNLKEVTQEIRLKSRLSILVEHSGPRMWTANCQQNFP
jgi:hypothetical protein